MIPLLFGLEKRVSRRDYALWGLSLMLLKYLGEAAFIYAYTGSWITPLDFINPLINERYPRMIYGESAFFIYLGLWSLPFIWVGASMSIRRAADAGWSPWWGMLFFVPGVNLILMAVLCALPRAPESNWHARHPAVRDRLQSPAIIALITTLIGCFAVLLQMSVVKQYGLTLFVLSPVSLGFTQGYLLNRGPNCVGFRKTLLYVLMSLLLVHLALLIFALEGLLCIGMSLPFTLVLAMFGATFGAGIARYGRSKSLKPMGLLFVLPVMPMVENQMTVPHRDVVLSVTEINAPPEAVWPNVIQFSELPPNKDLLFRLGVSHPVRARIEGTGVGAVRHCEYSTGAFVEPITAWEEPSRLAFDVKFQPQPMREWSFYDHVDAPHLDGFFRSQRGEFRLVRLEGGRTRLEGRTWYEMDIHPGWYWQIYGRWFIHRIHERVLNHIKDLTETRA